MYRFRPRPLPTIVAAIGVAFLFSLGTWQWRRMHEAEATRVAFAERLALPAFDAAAPPPDPHERRARVTGEPLWDRTFLLSGKYMFGGQPGYQVLVPVRHAAGAVLVNVGWVPSDEVDLVLAKERGEGSPRTYEGLARVYEEAPEPAGTFPLEEGYQRRWRAVSPKAMGAAAGLDVPAFVLVEGEGIPLDADIPDRVPPVGGWRAEPLVLPHEQYAITWYSLSLTLFVIWFSASFRRTV